MGLFATLAVSTVLTLSATPVPFGPDHDFQWSNAVSASVLSAGVFTPSPAVKLPPGDSAVKILIKITNGTAGQFDVSATTVDVKSGVDGTQARQFHDDAAGLSAGLIGAIAPGHSATAAYGFAIPTADLGLIDVEVAPDYNYDAAIFEGAAK
jgi:hypothetical protein